VLAAICAVAGDELADSLHELGHALRDAIDQWQWARKRRSSRS